MTYRGMALGLILLLVACSPPEAADDLPATAEAFLHSVYGCSSPVPLDELANADVSISYPVFQSLYGTPVIRGLEAVKALSDNFCEHWSNPSLSIDRALAAADGVALVWSFSATDRQAATPSDARQSWGGISVFRFDDRGRVLEELGEESSPGPMARMTTPPDVSTSPAPDSV